MDSTTTTLIPPRRIVPLAGRLEETLIITGGVSTGDQRMPSGGISFKQKPLSPRNIWMYHLIRKTWDVYHVPQDEDAPKSIAPGCTVKFGLRNLYAHGGHVGDSISNALWRLSMKAGHSNAFQWKELTFEKQSQTLSPRYCHSGWNYDSKLYIFGGSVPDRNATGYLDEGEDYIENYGNYASRQVHSYDLVHHEWTKVECSGDVPCHRYEHATTIVDDKVWLYGGGAGSDGRFLNDLRMLDMNTLIWTRVYTESEAIGLQVLPELCCHTLTAMSDSHLLLYGGVTDEYEQEEVPMDTKPWIFDIEGRSWRQIEAYEKDGRKDATATKGLDGDVIIVGGHILLPFDDESAEESDEDEEEKVLDAEEQARDNEWRELYYADALVNDSYEEGRENVLSVSISPPSLRTLAATALYISNVPVSPEDIGVDLHNFIFK